MKDLEFRSKVDTWVAVLIYSTGLMAIGVFALVWVVGPLALALTLGPVMLIGGLLPVWLLRSTRYVLGDTKLYIRSGPFRVVVPLEEIRSVKETRDPLSSPAFSMDRLRISYGRSKTVLISPEDKSAFLVELDKRRGGQ